MICEPLARIRDYCVENDGAAVIGGGINYCAYSYDERTRTAVLFSMRNSVVAAAKIGPDI